MNIGIRRTWNGSIMVLSRITNRIVRPGNSRRAKPYATSDEDTIAPVTDSRVMVEVLRNQRVNGSAPQPSLKLFQRSGRVNSCGG